MGKSPKSCSKSNSANGRQIQCYCLGKRPKRSNNCNSANCILVQCYTEYKRKGGEIDNLMWTYTLAKSILSVHTIKKYAVNMLILSLDTSGYFNFLVKSYRRIYIHVYKRCSSKWHCLLHCIKHISIKRSTGTILYT